MTWAIYYDDGSVFRPEDGSWDEAPTDGVVFAVERVGDRVNFHSGNDFYIREDGTIYSTGELGPLLRKLGFVKFGRWTSHKRMEQISERVRDEWRP